MRLSRRAFLQSASTGAFVLMMPSIQAPLAPAEVPDVALMQVTAFIRAFTEPHEKPLIGIDIQDYRAILRGMGRASFGEGVASGEGRASRAADLAIADLRRFAATPLSVEVS